MDFGLLYILPISFLAMRVLRSVGEREDVIVDTDAGPDDALALFMLVAKSSPVNVVAITCVRGNTGVTNVTRNVLTVLQVADRMDIPVYLGSKRSFVHTEKSDNYFGYDGFGNMDPKRKPSLYGAEEEHAALVLGQMIHLNPHRIKLICMGPLTNLALAIQFYPDTLKNVKEVIFGGGSYQAGGRMKPGVTFNVYADPEAAVAVFRDVSVDTPITLLPYETINDNIFDVATRHELGRMNSPYVRLLNEAERLSLPNETIFKPTDAMAAAVGMWPNLADQKELMYAYVEPCGEFARGAMIVDRSHGKPPNVNVIKFFNKHEFYKKVVELLDDGHE